MFLPSRRLKQLGLAGLPVVLLSALFIYFSKPDDAQPVRVVEALQAPLTSSLTTNGKVEPTERQELRASAPSFVRNVLVREGDRVRRGQIVVELAQGQALTAVTQAQAELQAAESDLQVIERGGSAAEQSETAQKLKDAQAARAEAARTLAANERLLKANAIAPLEVEQSRQRLQQAERDVAYLEQRERSRYGDEDRKRAQSRIDSARAALALAQQQLNSTRLAAPQGGTVYSLPVRVGNFVQTGEVLALIGNLDVVRVHAFVDEPELGRLAPGQVAEIGWDALPGATWSGKVERVPAQVTTLGTRSVGEVLCTINNKDRRLLANVNVDVEIIVERRVAAISLPREAVLHSDHDMSSHYVFVVAGDTVHRRAVQLGASSPTRFEIVSGLQPGEKVAIPGDRPLSEGQKIRPIT